MNLNDFEKLIDESPDLSIHKDYLLKISKPNVVITITKDGPNKLESKFGGKPLVPKGFEWPTHKIGEYRFLGHINFDETFDLQPDLPSTGLLSLFYAQDEEGEVFWGDDGYILGYYWPDLTILEPMEPPHRDYPRSKRIKFHGGVDIPRHEELRDDWPFDVELLDFFIDALPDDYMLGFPSFNSLAYDPTPGKDWRVLLTLDSHDQFDWCWHDGDKLMIFIQAENLRSGNFNHLKSDAG